MAVRLSVVMIQNSPPIPNAERVAQGVVGELIGMNGIDLTLIGPLDSFGDASTDRLTLESITGDLAVLDWQQQEAIEAGLGRLGIGGRRVVHASDQGVKDSGRTDKPCRKLYLFNLHEFTRSEDVIAAVAELNSVRSVRTFTLDLGLGSRGAASSQGEDLSPDEKDSSANRVAGSTELDSDSQSGQNSGVNPQKTDASEKFSEIAASDEFDLDALIDQLDELDP